MTKKQRNYFFLGSIISVFVMAVAVLFGTGKVRFSPLNVRGTSEIVEGSITWTWDNSERTSDGYGKYSLLRKTVRGTNVYLYSYGAGSPNSSRLWSSRTSSSSNTYGLFLASQVKSRALFEFQSISSISLVTTKESDSNATFYIYDGDTSTTPLTTKTITSPGETITFTPSSRMTQLSINTTTANKWVEFSSVTINYSCNPDGYPSEKSLVSISIAGQNTEFTEGDTFAFGGTVTAHYSDLTTADVTALSTFSGYDMSETGAQTVTVSYTESDVTRTATYGINVSEAPQGVTLSGTYDYTSRARPISDDAKDWNATDYDMYLVFNSNLTGSWVAVRPDQNALYKYRYVSTVNFTYTTEISGSNLSVTLTVTDIDFKKYRRPIEGGDETEVTYSPTASDFSGGTTDRPVPSGISAGAVNNTLSVSTYISKETITLSTYKYDKNTTPKYQVYDSLTFTYVSKK